MPSLQMKKLTTFCLSLTLALSSFTAKSQENQSSRINIIPEPVSVKEMPGNFTLTDKTVIYCESAQLKRSADFLAAYLEKFYAIRLRTVITEKPPAKGIVLTTRGSASDSAEGYHLVVTPTDIRISGHPRGVFYGIQSVIQLLPLTKGADLELPCAEILDYPRFAYRGMMLDCGRHFFDVAFVKKYIDFIAMNKMNTFHWHLTEDQGWRIEIKKYPRLTQVGAWRDSTLIGSYGSKPWKFDHHRSGGYYTQEQIREIVKYAQDRYVTIIPEIEMPGHSTAAITAYPRLACQPGRHGVGSIWGVYDTILCPTDYTFNFYENVLKEVMALFPSHYIHIGGDEAPKTTWKSSAFCQGLMKKLNLKNEDELQSYFIHRMEKFLNAHGRDIIGWDEILEGGLAPNATVMSWRGEAGGIAAAKLHHRVIMTPGTYCYLDHSQAKNSDSLTIGGYLPLQQVYNYNPVSKELTPDQGKYIIGVQGNVWTEYMEWPTKVEFMIFPRMNALGEVAWSQPDNKNYDNFLSRLQAQYQRYQLWGVSYYKDSK